MTVTYTHEVSTGGRGFGNFRRLLFRWVGSIYKLVLADLIIYVILYYSINIPYRFVLAGRNNTDPGKQYFTKLVLYAREASSSIPLQFILGFYVSQVLARWWNLFMTIPWPDTIAVTIASNLRGHDERGRLMRRTILRYVNACLAMVFCMVSPQARTRFPTLDDMVSAGYLVPHEKLIIDHLNEKTPGPKYYVPIVWAGSVVAKARKENRIKDDVALYHILKEICRFRTMAGDVLSYDWVNIPLVYTQVATLCAYIYFFSCLMGKQLLSADSIDEVDIYVPIFLFMEFVFMLGWLKVAETMINPFGEDDDDFEVNWLMDRNITVSYMIVDEMNDEFPEMLKDAFWEGKIPDELMYTPEALKYKTAGMGSGSAGKKEEVEGKMEGKVGPSPHNSAKSLTGRAGGSSREPDAEKGDAGNTSVIHVTEDFINRLMEHGKGPEYKDSSTEQAKKIARNKPIHNLFYMLLLHFNHSKCCSDFYGGRSYSKP